MRRNQKNMIDWHNIAKLLTEKWTKEKKLPRSSMVHEHIDYDQIMYYEYINSNIEPMFIYYANYGKFQEYGIPINKDIVIKELWETFDNTTKLELMAYILGNNNE